MAAEFANGHLAMMAIIGMFFQDGLTRSSWGDRSLYTASPLRALNIGLGVQDPVGFWDPVCFTSDGNVEDFKRRPQTKLKRSRDATLATMGYITLESRASSPAICLLIWVSSSRMCRTAWRPPPRCPARVGHSSLLTVPSASFRRTSRPALRPERMTLASRCPHQGPS